jgi:transcription termination/antitermination protein NusG
MTAMTKIEVQEIQWFAVRMKRPKNPGRRTCIVGAEFEAYRDRNGRVRKRRMGTTGTRVYVPEHLLRRAGFDVFLPVRKEWRRLGRYTVEKELVSFPLLVDWLFVGWPVGDCRWHDLMSMDVVAGVMGTGGRPIQIPEQHMMNLMRLWGGGVLSPQLHRYMRKGHEFCVGDTARVVAGPLLDQDIRVVEIDGPMTRGLLETLGGDIQVEIETDVLVRGD